MSVENGSIEQHYNFYNKRVEMAPGILSMETLALLGFNFEKITSEIKFPTTFWTSLQLLIQNLSQASLTTVSSFEQKVTANKLLTAFGNVTTAETIEPHEELTAKVNETDNNLSENLNTAKFMFIAMLNQIKQLITTYHQEQLLEIPTEESEEKVSKYLDNNGQQSDSETVSQSFTNSRRAFTIKTRKNKKIRERLLNSLELWSNFAAEVSATVLGGKTTIESKLKMA